MVTYNVARDWDLPTLIHNLKEAGWRGVELRTEHAHKVETILAKLERAEVDLARDAPIILFACYRPHLLDVAGD